MQVDVVALYYYRETNVYISGWKMYIICNVGSVQTKVFVDAQADVAGWNCRRYSDL